MHQKNVKAKAKAMHLQGSAAWGEQMRLEGKARAKEEELESEDDVRPSRENSARSRPNKDLAKSWGGRSRSRSRRKSVALVDLSGTRRSYRTRENIRMSGGRWAYVLVAVVPDSRLSR